MPFPSSPTGGKKPLVIAGALIACALTFGLGVAPASADTNPVGPDGISQSDIAASHSITLHIQRQGSIRGDVVLSVGLKKLGSTAPPQCLNLPGPVPNLIKPGLHYTSGDLRVSTPGQFIAYSYADFGCHIADYIPGTAGTIDPYRWQTWTVYTNRPPKLTL